MATILDISKRFKRELLSLEERAATDLVQKYGETYSRLEIELNALLALIAKARARRETVSISWLQRESRLELLMWQTALEIKRFAEFADLTILNGQREAVTLALQRSTEAVRAGIARAPTVGLTFDRLPVEAVENLVGRLSDGSPLRALLNKLGPEAAENVGNSLVSAVAQGLNPRQIAREIRDTAGITLHRALTISRTETISAGRNAALENYRANPEVVTGWVRLETLGPRSCPVCIALHGTRYRLETDFDSHPNCRGTMVPEIEGVPSNVQSGELWFDRQDDQTQKEILGPSKHEAFSRGEISLLDLVERENDPDWGPQIRERSLADALASQRRQRAA